MQPRAPQKSTSDPTLLDELAKKRIIFVSGKGGVGKSLVAACLANELARKGIRVLLAEIGQASYFKDYFSLRKVAHLPMPIEGLGFQLALWSGDSSLHEYVLHYLKMERLYRLFFENKVMRALVGVAPGLNEIAILGKVTSGLRRVGPNLSFDTIVVDCYATGHALALFQAARGMMQAIPFGPMGTHSREIDRVLQNAEQTAYVAVSLLEELPVVETIEFSRKLKETMGATSIIIANKVLQPPFARELLADLIKIKDSENSGVIEFARYTQAVLERQDKMRTVLVEQLFRQPSELLGRAPMLAEVPLVLSTDPLEIVIKAGEALRKI